MQDGMERLRRKNSEDSVATLVNLQTEGYSETSLERNLDDQSDLVSFWSRNSDTTTIHDVDIFNQHITNYRVLRQLPVVSSFLQQGVYLFSSMKSVEIHGNRSITPQELENYHREGLGFPLLQTSTSMLSVFNRSSPFMTIHKFDSPSEKREFCKVYFKILENNITCYIFMFQLSEGPRTLILVNNGINPSVDFLWENTKCRVTGVTGTTSTFGKGLIKICAMATSSILLSDDLEIDSRIRSTSNLKPPKIRLNESNQLYSAIRSRDKTLVNKIINEGKPLIEIPFSSIIDDGDVKIQGKMIKNATIKVFDSHSHEINENCLIISSVLLTLREQEYRKNRGNSKPRYI